MIFLIKIVFHLIPNIIVLRCFTIDLYFLIRHIQLMLGNWYLIQFTIYQSKEFRIRKRKILKAINSIHFTPPIANYLYVLVRFLPLVIDLNPGYRSNHNLDNKMLGQANFITHVMIYNQGWETNYYSDVFLN